MAEDKPKPEMSPETRKSLDELLRVTKISGKRRTTVDVKAAIERERERAAWEAKRRAEAEAWEAKREAEARERERLRVEALKAEAERAKREEEERLLRERAKHRPVNFTPSTHNEVAVLGLNPAKACVVLRAPLSELFVEDLERTIPVKYRWWNGQDQVFEFHASVVPHLKVLLKQYYQDVQVIGGPKAIPATKFDRLMAKLSKDDKAAIYRLLATRYHPDRGGDADTMVLINQVFKEKL